MTQLELLWRSLVQKNAQFRHLLINASPPAILMIGYLTLILLGAGLLKLDMATVSSITWLDALFTATSAVTVTGLVVVDTGTGFSVFGQVVIALLIQAGGLGFMTFSILTILNLGKRLGVRHQLVALEALNQTSFNSIKDVSKAVIVFSLAIEAIGFLLLVFCWVDEYSFSKAAYHAFFYTISAFNNAGFALSADGLTAYQGDIPVNLIITALFIIGGIGFVVLQDVWKKCGWKKLQVYTKVMISSTVMLNLLAWLLVWLFERKNPATIGGFSLSDQLTASWFQAVTPRTAGFNTLPIESLTDSTSLLMLILMFIGGGSLSTASGIKLGTFVVLLITTYSFLMRHDEVTIMRRSIPLNMIMKSFAVTVISMMLVLLGSLMLSAIQEAPLLDILFEVVSALGTVGLSRGLTGDLNIAGQLLIMLLMFVGRLGPLTVAYVIAIPKQRRIKYPSIDIQIG
ncbi:TrkH family potassium uptake protein [Methylicorpusculum oleiharenae]|uniref:TrkH family potassium uptake protein n=1 Tax=Methylicorpusculum oleiharenae TaxID=1338687 RepID=UPI001359BA94|nr:TrkH family potassium uptake protein [Methylicorpusculum oleiharenae]MCD2451279.1 TrkH family potassium uptake protein [Methylicorpusculum oleiharenae]